MNQTTAMLERFCMPPTSVETEFDRKVLADASVDRVEFEGHALHCYSWGRGRPVLMIHGWGSRASHLALLARHVARSGFRAVVLDGPSHGKSLKKGLQQSSMFEFGRALFAVASQLEPLYALLGHSLGGLAAFFGAAGHGKLADYRLNPERLVLISSPISINYVVRVYCQRENMNSAQERELAAELEQGFDFSISDYSALKAVGKVPKLMIVHDEDDDEVPFSDALRLHTASHASQMTVTSGAGHQKILVDRAMMRSVARFLAQSATRALP